MIKTVVKTEDGTCMVFDAQGEQIPECQGPWEEVKERILRVPSAVIFGPKSIHLLRAITILKEKEVPR